MFRKQQAQKTTLNVNQGYEGESIEQKVNRIVNNKEPIKDSSPVIYTERKDGVKEATNIRTDRWEIACEGMDKVHKTNIAKRDAKVVEMNDQKKDEKKNDGGAEPTQGTDNKK